MSGPVHGQRPHKRLRYVHARVADGEFANLEASAKAAGVTISDFVRSALGPALRGELVSNLNTDGGVK